MMLVYSSMPRGVMPSGSTPTGSLGGAIAVPIAVWSDGGGARKMAYYYDRERAKARAGQDDRDTVSLIPMWMMVIDE